ncbi:MAG: aldo/keto reductase, partial [Pseudomonadota bacterium]
DPCRSKSVPPVSIERRILGRTGLSASAVGFGGSETGYAGVSARQVALILNDALDRGLNLIDTAACYGDGEAQLGAVLSHRRKDVILITKCGHAAGLAGDDWDPAMLAKSIDRSLKRLRTDYVDIMQFHSPDAATLDDPRVIEVLTRARAAGKARFIGLSSDGESALAAVELGVFDTLQTSLSLADQEAIDLTIPKAYERGMGVIAKRSLANAAWRADSRGAYAAPYRERLGKLGYDFLTREDAGATALRFTLSVPGLTAALVGTTRLGRFEQNARAAALGMLPSEEYEEIRARWRCAGGANWPGQR